MKMETEVPPAVARNLNPVKDDEWYEYDDEQLFNDDVLERIRTRFTEMNQSEYKSIASVGSGITKKTKIRTKDLPSFRKELSQAQSEWIETHGGRLTAFGNSMYGEILTPYSVVEINEEKPRKTVLWAQYDSGQSIGLGGAKYKKSKILKPIRDYEQWSYHNEVVVPLFDKYHEKYPY